MKKLLVVDDNKQNLYMAEVLLSSNGYQVELAANGIEALKKARASSPDLIIADILMPGMDGFALCREWKQDETLKAIPFIFYTATYTDPEDEKFALGLGADRFIVKPVAPENLVAAIREVLEKFNANHPVSDNKDAHKEDVYLKQYNQALIHKLEDKLAQLEASNQALEKEILERKHAEQKITQLERQFAQSQKMEAIGTLAGGIAHDFNNILLAIMGHAEIALLKNCEGETSEKHLKEVLNACDRAKDLVNQILTFSRQTNIVRKPIQTKVIIKEALKLLRSSLPTTITLRQDLKSDGRILANPTQIYQVMMNLCTNASFAMKERGGIIDVILTDVDLDTSFVSAFQNVPPGAYQKLEIIDTGIGIAQSQLAHIFEPYFTSKQKGEGTGLGLSVVRGIVKDTGGIITVHSEPRKGSTFTVFFPTFHGEFAAIETQNKILKGNGEHVLFVDDEPALIEIGVEQLKRLGYQVTAFRDSQAALKSFKERPDAFDFVITDMTMPQLTGMIFAKELLEIRPELPVILCTGFSDEITEEKAAKIGISALLKKPFLLYELSKTIRQAFGN